jgi:hypothetical protein
VGLGRRGGDKEGFLWGGGFCEAARVKGTTDEFCGGEVFVKKGGGAGLLQNWRVRY